MFVRNMSVCELNHRHMTLIDTMTTYTNGGVILMAVYSIIVYIPRKHLNTTKTGPIVLKTRKTSSTIV